MTTTPPTREELISRKAAAHLMKIHPNTLDRAAAAAGLAKYRVLGDTQVFYRRDEIAQLDAVIEVPE